LVKVSLTLYGENAQKLARELGIIMNGSKKTLPMNAEFENHSVNGHSKIYCTFNGGQ
jgi:hypothetical protein